MKRLMLVTIVCLGYATAMAADVATVSATPVRRAFLAHWIAITVAMAVAVEVKMRATAR